MYVVVIIETESDTPGIEHSWGPYTEHEAERIRRLTRDIFVNLGRDPELVQVSLLERV